METAPPFRRILVPLDGSAFAEAALPWAQTLAQHSGGLLDLVSVISPFVFPQPRNPQEESIVQGWFTEEEERLKRYLDGVRARLAPSGLRIRTNTPRGPVVPTLVEWMERLESDLTVLTTHGRGGFRRAWLGSVADGLIREGPGSVLLIPPVSEEAEGDRPPHFEHILVPLDGSDRSERALRDAVTFARAFGSTLSLLTVVPKPVVQDRTAVAWGLTGGTAIDAVLEGLRAYLEGRAEPLREEGLTVVTDAREAESAASGILDAAGRSGADLLVMATRGRSGVRRLVLGSVADKVIRGSERPVLVHRDAGDLG